MCACGVTEEQIERAGLLAQAGPPPTAMTEEIPIQRLIEQNARYMLEQMRAADPSDAVRYSAAVKNLAGSLAELSGGGDTPSGLRSIIEKLNQASEK